MKKYFIIKLNVNVYNRQFITISKGNFNFEIKPEDNIYISENGVIQTVWKLYKKGKEQYRFEKIKVIREGCSYSDLNTSKLTNDKFIYIEDKNDIEYLNHVFEHKIKIYPQYNIKQILDKVRINPANVTLEVTESLAINDMERMKRVLKQLKALGVCVALDDFGTGYSSLNHIREMPIDVIKIDRCFVENLSEDEFASAFVKMVSELAKTIGVAVCVEGVEQRKQLEVLKDMNIKMIQGYYYGKPMPVAEFENIYFR